MRVSFAIISLGLLISMIEAMQIASSDDTANILNSYIESTRDLTKMAIIFDNKLDNHKAFVELGDSLNNLKSNEEMKKYIDETYSNGPESNIIIKLDEAASRHIQLISQLEKHHTLTGYRKTEGTTIENKFKPAEDEIKLLEKNFTEQCKELYPNTYNYLVMKLQEAKEYKNLYINKILDGYNDIEPWKGLTAEEIAKVEKILNEVKELLD